MNHPLRLALVLVALATVIAAQNRKLMHSTRPTEVRTPGNVENAVTATWSLDFSSAYFFRGMRRETQGAIAQPNLELAYGITEGDGSLGNVDFVIGSWNTLHDGPTGTRGGRQVWYESDFYIGGAVGFADNWAASTTYSWFASPNGTFATVEELTFGISLDDSDSWSTGEEGGFGGLHPSASISVELTNQADFISSPAAQDRGMYGQIAVAPTLALGQTGELDWTLTLPAAIGFSLGDYYEDPATGGDKVLGFIEFGAEAKTAVPYIPSRFGPWEMTVALQALILGDSTETMNGGDAFELIASIGFSTRL